MKSHKYAKYRPKRCMHPEFEGVCYCWGLALHIDNEGKPEDMDCEGCEYNKGENK